MSFKFNPITATLDLVGQDGAASENFSYKRIPQNATVLIPEEQIMLCYESLDVEGTLDLEGYLAFVESSMDNFSYELVEETRKVKIPSGQQMLVDRFINVEGVLDIEGKLIIVEV